MRKIGIIVTWSIIIGSFIGIHFIVIGINGMDIMSGVWSPITGDVGRYICTLLAIPTVAFLIFVAAYIIYFSCAIALDVISAIHNMVVVPVGDKLSDKVKGVALSKERALKQNGQLSHADNNEGKLSRI